MFLSIFWWMVAILFIEFIHIEVKKRNYWFGRVKIEQF